MSDHAEQMEMLADKMQETESALLNTGFSPEQ
jgi:hypothetical protein